MGDLQEKINRSIERLKAFEPEEGYYLAFSGGKDSVVCKALLDMAGCKYDATYRVTSVDPPELVRFIKETHPDVKREVPRYSESISDEKLRGRPITMWNLIPHKLLPPTRVTRYCCNLLKESGGDGRMIVTGVRWAESMTRRDNQGIVTFSGKTASKDDALKENKDFHTNNYGGVVLTNDNADSRRMVEQCYKRHKTTVNPIIDWQDEDVWEFIHRYGVPYCSLYDEGFTRLGCIGCPLCSTKDREHELIRWPKYKGAYFKAFERMLAERKRRGRLNGTWSEETTARDAFNWWMKYDILPGQFNLFEDYDEEDGE